MLLSREMLRSNITLYSIILFVALYAMLYMLKPNFMFNTDGSLRDFGVGYKRKTIMPAWLAAIVLAILSYFFVLYYLTFPRLNY